MECKICDTKARAAVKHQIRKDYLGEFALCPNCDLLFAINPTWLDEAYVKPINATDTGYVTRNLYLSRKTLLLFAIMFGKNGRFIDYAAGYGMLVRLMRDYGLDFLWYDPYTKNLFAEGFEYHRYTDGCVDAVTCFECFEHLADPVKDIEKMLDMTDTIFFSTKLRPEGIVPNEEWEYYGWDHGQHVAFYSEKTLRYIAHKYSLHFYTDRSNLHILTKRKLPRFILRAVNLLTKIQADLLVRKSLSSRTDTDQKHLISKGI